MWQKPPQHTMHISLKDLLCFHNHQCVGHTFKLFSSHELREQLWAKSCDLLRHSNQGHLNVWVKENCNLFKYRLMSNGVYCVIRNISSAKVLNRPHVVTVEWLVASIKQRCPASEDAYTSLETRKVVPEPQSPLSQKVSVVGSYPYLPIQYISTRTAQACLSFMQFIRFTNCWLKKIELSKKESKEHILIYLSIV